MARGERPLAADGGALTNFAADLRRLRRKAGNLTYRVLAERAHYSTATLSNAANGRSLPSLAVTLAYVRACGGDVREWEQRWQALAAELAETSRAGEADAAQPDAVPYRGLAAFQPEDADWFFGRERLAAQLLDRLSHQRFVAVVGASGVGKSSLLRAGLVPQCRTGEGHRSVVMFTPGVRPMEECAIHLARLTGRTAAQQHADLTADPHSLHLTIRQALVEHDNAELVLVVDQFEEIFTLCADETEREQFISMLLAAARVPNSRCRVVLGVRADFYGHCTRRADLVAAFTDAQVPVGPMTTDELRRAIVQPAARAHCAVEGALLAELIARADGNAAVLPMVSHALLETWRRRRGNTLTLAGYQAAGGVDGALARTAEAAYTGLSEVAQRQVRDLFLRLTALGEGTEDTKRRIDRSELTTDTGGVLELLATARLITLADSTVEIAHEALIAAWPRLRHWLATDRDGLRTRQQLNRAARDWAALDEDRGALYRGVRLAVAREWAGRDGNADELNPVERAFLDASIELESREHAARMRRTRQLRYLSLALAALLVAAITVGFVAMRQRQDAVRASQLAISRQLATQALTMVDANPSVARLLSVEAFRIAPTMEARSAVMSMSAHQEYLGETTAHTGAISEVGFTPDGSTLISAGRDKTVALWDTDRRRRLATLTQHDTWIKAVAVSPDGRILATGGDDRRLMLWDLTSRTPLVTLTQHTGSIRAIAFAPDGRTLATTGDDRTVILWDLAARTQLATLTGHTKAVVEAAFSPDGRTLATASDDRTVILWDVASRTQLATLTGHTDSAVAVAFSPDGRTLATAGGDSAVLLWDVASRTRLAALSGHVAGTLVVRVAFSPDGRTLATAGTDKVVLLWDVTHRTLRARLTGHQQNVYAVAFNPATALLASAGEDGKIIFWDPTRPPLTGQPDDGTNDIAFSPDGQTLATAGAVRTTLWSTTTRAPIHVVQHNTATTANAITFSPDGRILATATEPIPYRQGQPGNTLTLRNAAEPAHSTELAGHTDAVLDVAFSPNGAMAATASVDRTVILWDLRHGMPLFTLDIGATVNGFAFSPDGRFLAAADHQNQNVTLWDLTTRTRAATLTGHTGWVRTVAFSPDGRTLASASADQTVILWDIATGAQIARLTDHKDTHITGVAFSPDGRTLAYSSADNTVILWDLNRHAPTARLTGHTEPIHAIAFSPDGHTLAASSADHTVLLWQTDPEQTAQRICQTLSRDLTHEEWAQHIPELHYRETCGAA